MNTDRHTYATIKDLAAQLGKRVTDLLALASQNDPFYAGSPASVEQAQWFAGIWQLAGFKSNVHLRRIHYWIVSQRTPITRPNGQPYENTDKCWDYLSQASKMARYLGVVSIENIADNKNPKPILGAEYSLYSAELGYQINVPDLSDPDIWVSGLNNVNAQPYHLELWCEKSTMNDVLAPLCRRYNANLLTFEGEVSITACYQLMRRIQESGGKPTRIWYLSDFDPAGASMPVAMSRKIEYMLMRYGQDFDLMVRPLLLNAQQVQHYRLPRTPIKETEKRAARFEEIYGTGAVELDALEALYPGELARMVEKELKRYYSPEAAQEVNRRRMALHAVINDEIAKITEAYAPQIAALQQMIQALKDIDIDPTPYAVEQYPPHVEEAEASWLFSSNRPYQDQIDYYKAHKNNERVGQ